MKISRVGVAIKPGSDEALAVAKKLMSFLEGKGLEVFRYGEGANRSNKRVVRGLERVDLIVVVGGDGTVMRTAQQSADVPILGVKVGALGFLCETAPDGAIAALEKVLAGEYYLEYKTKLRVRCGKKELPDVLNEALICTSKPSKILSLMVRQDGESLHRGKADGVIVSTTTGATAYALSAGGPIVDPRLDITEVVFICPLATGLKPIILPTSAKVEITVLPGAASGMVVLDGQLAVNLDYDTTVTVERSENRAVFVRVSRPDFYSRIRGKIRMGLEV